MCSCAQQVQALEAENSKLKDVKSKLETELDDLKKTSSIVNTGAELEVCFVCTHDGCHAAPVALLVAVLH